jgi:cytochrome c oxidase assembly protein subunit 15
MSNVLRYVVSIAMVLALLVVMLGAYTRLTNAGLGCPDWPGCYGHMVLPSAQHQLMKAQHQYPEIPIESRKAWTEMLHRYAAGTLGLLIFITGGLVLYRNLFTKKPPFPWVLPLILVFLVIFQAALGMWTVTLKLLPIVVMAHLLGGVLIFANLCYYRLQLSTLRGGSLSGRFWIFLGVVLVFCQIALGGWVSANYAGISCIGFPTCNGQWLPKLHLYQGFNLFSSVGANYQGGVLDHDVRMTIQWIHRLGAVIVAGYLLLLSTFLLSTASNQRIRYAAGLVLILVTVQFTLGVLNVIYLLPLAIAVLHNGVAALLLAAMGMLFYLAQKERAYARR